MSLKIDLLRSYPGEEFKYILVSKWCQSLNAKLGSFVTYQIQSESRKAGLNWIYVTCVLGHLTEGFTADPWDIDKRAPLLTGGWSAVKHESFRYAVRQLVNELKLYATCDAVPSNHVYVKLYDDCSKFCIDKLKDIPPDNVPPVEPPTPEPEPPSESKPKDWGKLIGGTLMMLWIAIDFFVPLPGYVKAIVGKLIEIIAGSM